MYEAMKGYEIPITIVMTLAPFFGLITLWILGKLNFKKEGK